VIADRILADETATESFARELASAMPVSAEPLIVYLEGDLGTGKTTLARGMLRALGERGPVRSPTYGLLAQYPLPGGLVRHLDLYRLRGPEELEALALRDLLPGSRLWLVEWPGRGAGALPPPDLHVVLDLEGRGRGVHVSADSEAGRQWLGALSGSPER
jgi:tRNA threonylcarbamoyladenosine biosynthesis protein TsaE